MTNYDRIQITDTTNIKYPHTGGYLLQQWNSKCNDRKNNGKKQIFIKSTKTSSPTGHSGATSLPPIGDSFALLTVVIMCLLFGRELTLFKLLI